MGSIFPQLQIEPSVPIYLQIARQLERLIETKQVEPGQRLPPARGLAQQWGVDYKTVQKAMKHLKGAGLFERSPGRGTFVKASTEKVVIGLLLGESLADEHAHYSRSVCKALQDGVRERQWMCWIYDGLTTTKEILLSRNSPSHQRLQADLRNHSFAGFIRFLSGAALVGSLPEDKPLPQVTVAARPPQTDLVFDWQNFGRESVEFFVRKGKRRILYIRPESRDSEDLDGFLDATRSSNLPSPQVVSIGLEEHGYLVEKDVYQQVLPIMRQWQSRPPAERPDALLVWDDIAMRTVALVLAQCQIQVPNELLVLSLANEGIHLHYGFPVVRYEFSPGLVARELLGLLWRRIVGQTEPPLPMRICGQIRETENQPQSDQFL